ncbi:hypothetical protein K402DRAFT_324344 [Aulographum hederae CBS 113979]|uniref:Uncharacterized protein n=1 Tax=Aulographum hederae CBS 113979 TaxID=1176131 RepID=A0A6G1HCT2_9PEZI|nr:hypothetical protein K402DRAFT_324344 [Aulographum hederae CBS 113979]
MAVLRARRAVQYASSSVSSSSEGESEEERPVKSRARSRPHPRPRPQQKTAYTSPSKGKGKEVPVEEGRVFVGPSGGVRPNLDDLPYQILLEVVELAANPFRDSQFHTTGSTEWLLKLSTTSAQVRDAAVTALFRSPRLTHVNHPHQLLETLEGKTYKSGKAWNYNQRLNTLELDVEVVAHKAHKKPHFDLGSLIPHTPQLHHIKITNREDQPQNSRVTDTKIQWSYPPSLFENLRIHEQRLKTFFWNAGFFKSDRIGPSLSWMRSIHESKSFQTIETMRFTNYAHQKHRAGSTPPAESDSPAPEVELLAKAISTLPELKDLTFERCPIVYGELLTLLPKRLERLSFINCPELDSEDLQAFLSTHGSQLTELELAHNQSLDLDFLPELKKYCPKLQVLRVDLLYYSTTAAAKNNEPKYKWLLGDDAIPTWPSTLQSLEIMHLRKWSRVATTNFFNSIIYSAPELPDLRRIVLKASVEMAWKERSAFRQEWVDRLQTVFLRKPESPAAHLASMSDSDDSDDEPITRAGRVDGSAKRKRTSDDDDAVEIISTLSKKQRTEKIIAPLPTGRVLRSRKRPSVSSQITEEDHSDDTDYYPIMPQYIQGLCNVVDLEVDNNRPGEDTYTMAHFLDSEASGDEDWNGDDPDDDDGDGLAW